jgi:hypothetical protein
VLGVSSFPLLSTIFLSNANIDILLQEYHTHHSIFSFLCCAIMCRYFRSSMLWCPLRFPHDKMFGSFLLPVVNIGVLTSIKILLSMKIDDIYIIYSLENTEGATKNTQFRKTGN